jgi:hypothetical protein
MTRILEAQRCPRCGQPMPPVSIRSYPEDEGYVIVRSALCRCSFIAVPSIPTEGER